MSQIKFFYFAKTRFRWETMKASNKIFPRLAALIITLILVSQLSTSSPYSVSVSTSKDTYAPGEKVTVKGKVSPAASVTLGWELYDPNGKRRTFGQISSKSDGSFSFTISTSHSWPQGTYRVVVVVSGTSDKGSATFKLQKAAGGGAPGAPTAPIDYESKARIKMGFARSLIEAFNVSFGYVAQLLEQLNATIDYQAPLNLLQQALDKLQNAQQKYSDERYQDAYKAACEAEDFAEQAYKQAITSVKQALTKVASSILSRTNETFLQHSLNITLEKIQGISVTPRPQTLNELIEVAYQLIVASRAVQAPQLEQRLKNLVQQLETLKTTLTLLNQTYQQLEKEYRENEQKLQALREQLQKLQESYNELAGNYASLVQDHQNLKNAYNQLQQENSKLRHELAQRFTATHLAIVALIALAAGYVISKKLK